MSNVWCQISNAFCEHRKTFQGNGMSRRKLLPLHQHTTRRPSVHKWVAQSLSKQSNSRWDWWYTREVTVLVQVPASGRRAKRQGDRQFSQRRMGVLSLLLFSRLDTKMIVCVRSWSTYERKICTPNIQEIGQRNELMSFSSTATSLRNPCKD